MASPARRRLDAELVRRGLVTSRTAARDAIVAGRVTVDGGPALKAATQVHSGQAVALAAPRRRFVSRGGDKLAHALDRFAITVSGRHCLDAGASTGGFTDCLLQHGAARVVAVDVGYGQIHERLRHHDRVVVLERTNVRHLTADRLPPPAPELAVCDVSFIPLVTVLPALVRVTAPDGEAVVLIKPQFEAGRRDVGKGGVVRDPAVWRRVLTTVAGAAADLGWRDWDVTASPLVGPAGNVEFLARLSRGTGGDTAARIGRAVDEALTVAAASRSRSDAQP